MSMIPCSNKSQRTPHLHSTRTFHIMLYTSVLGITNFICDSMIVGRNHEIERLVLEPRPYWDVLYSNHLLAEDDEDDNAGHGAQYF